MRGNPARTEAVIGCRGDELSNPSRAQTLLEAALVLHLSDEAFRAVHGARLPWGTRGNGAWMAERHTHAPARQKGLH